MEPTRRSLLIKASAGAAGTAAVLGGGLALSSATSAGDEAPLGPDELADLDRPVLVEIRDARRGEVEVLVGERAVTFTDRALVAKVLRATRRENR